MDRAIGRWYRPYFRIDDGVHSEETRDSFSERHDWRYQAFGIPGRRSLAAIFTKSARESAFIFRITLPRCAFTVISLMLSSPPTCLFNRPRTTNAMTCRSRRLSEA